MGTSIGARNAIGGRTRLGTLRTKSGTSCALPSGQRPILKQLGPLRSATRTRQRNAGQRSLLNGRRPTDRSATPSMQGGRQHYFAQRQHGQIKTQSRGFTPKQCGSRKKPESESTSTISCHFKARSFAACMLNRICKYLMGPKMRASAISGGRTCHNRIEQAYAQPRLFEDAKVGAGETAVQGDMLLPANVEVQRDSGGIIAGGSAGTPSWAWHTGGLRYANSERARRSVSS